MKASAEEREMTATDRQRTLLKTTRTRIADDPASYRQGAWGNGRPECGTPGCIAGHIIAVDAERQARVLGIDEEARDSAIEREATSALELETTPKLFDPVWPREWQFLCGRRARPATTPPMAPHCFRPDAKDAVAVLDAILDGRIEDPLDKSTMGP